MRAGFEVRAKGKLNLVTIAEFVSLERETITYNVRTSGLLHLPVPSRMLYVLSWIVVTFSVPAYAQGLDLKALEEVIATVRKDHEQIQSLHVEFSNTITSSSEETEGNSHTMVFQWAMSGEKEYSRHEYPAQLDPLGRAGWGLAVWDGKTLKAYESISNGGSLRLANDPMDGDRPRTSSAYSVLLGHPTHGRFPKLFDELPLTDWEAQWIEPERIARLSTSSSLLQPGDNFGYAWTIDLSKGSCVTKYEWLVKDDSGGYYPFVTDTAGDRYELLPGIWIASSIEHDTRDMNGDRLGGSLVFAANFKVNDAVPNSLFEFTFPEGSDYYDVSLGQTIRVGVSQKSLERMMDDAVTEYASALASEEPIPMPREDLDQKIKALDVPPSRSGKESHHVVAYVVILTIALTMLIFGVWRYRRRKT